MRRISSLLLILPLLLSLLTACTAPQNPPPTAEAILTAMATAMTRTAQTLPEGRIYSRQAAAEGPGYLSEVFFTALYGRAAEGLLEGEEAAVGDGAMFLSVAPYPCELAVFRCSDADAVPSLVALCRGRVDTVLRGYGGTRWESVARGLVVTEGCFVLLIIAEDPTAVAEAAGAAMAQMG